MLPIFFKVCGGYFGGVTPVPIPNTEVKPTRADGTAREAVWESRSPPHLFEEPALVAGFSFFWAPSRALRGTLAGRRGGALARSTHGAFQRPLQRPQVLDEARALRPARLVVGGAEDRGGVHRPHDQRRE